jgi:branched-chain amino acid transport system substrate-binding protein
VAPHRVARAPKKQPSARDERRAPQQDKSIQMTQEPFRIGVLFSETGVTSVIERSELMGTLLAVEEVNQAGGIDGRELQLVRYDPASTPARYQQLAERLLLEDDVRVILGCYMSSTRKAVIPVVEKYNGLLMYPTLYEGFEYSRNVIYTGAAPNQNSVQLAEFMLRTFGSRVFMVGSDYIYPYESNRIMSDLVLERGGEKVAEHYLPLDASWEDFQAITRRIKQLGPDFIFSTVVGDGTALLYRACREAKLDPSRMPIGSLTTCEAEVQQMGAGLAEGHITSAVYFQSVATPQNEQCVATCRQRFGPNVVLNLCWEAAYFQTHLLANALRRAGTDNVRELLRMLPGSEFLAPQGLVRIDEDNHHTYLRPRIGRVNAKGQFDILEEATTWVRPDPYLVDHTLQDWSVRVPLQAQ